MLLLLLHFLLWAAALIGLGWSVSRWLTAAGSSRLAAQEMAVSGWLGLLVLAAAGELLHFFVPLGGWVSLPFLLFGLAAFGIRHRRKPPGPFVYVLSSILSAMICAMAARPITHGDSGLYHIQAVKWIAEYPLLKGWGNVHGRFGFNSAWWLDGALLDLPSMHGQGIYLINGLAVLFTGLFIWQAMVNLWEKKPGPGDWVLLASIYLWYRQMVGENHPSPSTDLPTNLLIITTVALLCKGLTHERKWLLPAVVLSVFAVTIKLSAAPLAAGSVLIGLWHNQGEGKRFPFIVKSALPLILYLGLWLLRGIMITGYPLYPSAVAGPVINSWAVPLSQVKAESQAVTLWARNGNLMTTRPKGLIGIKEMVVAQHGTINLFFAGILLVGVVALFGATFMLGREKTVSPWPYCLPGLVVLSGLIYVLIFAPAFRFASGYFFSLMGLILGYAAQKYDWSQRRLWTCTFLGASLFGTVFLHRNSLHLEAVSLIQWPVTVQPQSEIFRTSSGVNVNVPSVGEACWDMKLPAFPWRNERVLVVTKKDGTIAEFRNQTN